MLKFYFNLKMFFQNFDIFEKLEFKNFGDFYRILSNRNVEHVYASQRFDQLYNEFTKDSN